ncbi:PIN domain nuclease [Nonomuraea sp. NPDC048826]|uniref:PIN domain nuclease n=1 Tax=Nonomuraea sp. NPDC048826 TaxID=3364347 RepID=UPI003724765F
MAATGVIYLLDTSALARIRTSEVVAKALHPLYAARVVATCDIIDLEVGYSARNHAHYKRIIRAQHQVIRLSAGQDVWARAREVQLELIKSSQHRGVSPPDLLIAACAEVYGATVLHYDRDYDRIAEVTGQPSLWVVPPGSVP